ncbi:putative transposase [Yoonia maricola]|uniref:Putative transposase n=1 Tax=Yoonia maricola TaxID=420999 RepID=A0A2M8W2G4_9RHOB|nr:transposase [Yoonia maricola]PJI85088.1 putative transposase [Yoonia maricola]
MSNYRRLRVPGGTYFFTVRLQDQRSDLLVTHIDLLRDATRVCRKRWPFAIDAAVILPNKLHMIWTLPMNDHDFSKRWRMIKSGFSRHAPAPAHIPKSHQKRGEKGIWQRRFWEHMIRDEDDMALHMHLIRSAPIHAGLVKRPSDWPYSSLNRAREQALRTTAPAPSIPNPKAAAIAS